MLEDKYAEYLGTEYLDMFRHREAWPYKLLLETIEWCATNIMDKTESRNEVAGRCRMLLHCNLILESRLVDDSNEESGVDDERL